MSRYTEHRMVETGPLLVADSTLESGARKVWIGAGGMDGRWLTHEEFRAVVAELIAFAEALPPSGVPPSQDERTRQFFADVASSPEKARAFLQDAGILDERGDLAEPYRADGVAAVEAPSNEAVEEDRRTVLQLLYAAHQREPCGPTLEAITAAIQHLQAVDALGVGGTDGK